MLTPRFELGLCALQAHALPVELSQLTAILVMRSARHLTTIRMRILVSTD